jgi:uncharacterized membrane protein
MVTAARTTSQVLFHMATAFTVMYIATGSATFGGVAAVIEPICNVALLPFHDRLWKRIGERIEARRQSRANLSPQTM